MATILLVEDERDLSYLVRRHLEDEGHRVVQAFDGPRAVQAAPAERPDLVILDWMLPGLDGLEVTPGTVTAASQSGLTVQTKDGATRTFGVDARTHRRATPANGDQVVVVTKNGAPNALAVFGPHGGRGWWGGA